jgi:hypothetical protein
MNIAKKYQKKHIIAARIYKLQKKITAKSGFKNS